MKTLELMDAVAVAIEALTATPLSTYEAYVTTPPSIRDIGDEAVFIDLAEGGGEEMPMGISAGVGRWEESVALQLTATFDAEDTDASRDKAFDVLAQLKKFCYDNREISAGGETARYATWSNPLVGWKNKARDEKSGQFRAAQLTITWTVDGET